MKTHPLRMYQGRKRVLRWHESSKKCISCTSRALMKNRKQL